MTVYIFEDVRELYEKYTDDLRERTKLEVLVNGVPDEAKTQIKDAIQELLAAEVIDLAHQKFLARGVSDELLLNVRRDVRPTLKKLPLPEKDHRILESKVRLLAREMMPFPEVVGSTTGTGPPLEPMLRASHTWHSHDTHGSHDTSTAEACVCVWDVMPGHKMDMVQSPGPGKVYKWWIPDEAIFNVRVDHEVLPIDEIEIGLRVSTDWAKEIASWHPCIGKLASVYAEKGDNPRYIRLKDTGCHPPLTIMFRKPKFLGIWADVGHINERQFWSFCGGKRLTFDWYWD